MVTRTGVLWPHSISTKGEMLTIMLTRIVDQTSDISEDPLCD